jgi:hypothetical protein
MTTMLTREQFIGVWKLVSWENHLADGTVSYPFGEDALGCLCYWDNGFMATEIMTADRLPQRSSEDLFEGTTEEKAAMMRTFLAYCGRFEVSGATVIHHIEIGSFPNWVGKGHVRSARFDGPDRLVLSLPMPIGGVEQMAYFTWQRI